MATRQLSRAGQAIPNTPAAVSIADLPEAVLAHTMGFLDLKERQRTVLVSKRFAAAACSPHLLRQVEVEVSLAGMASFVPWLARHGQHVWCLEFTPDRSAPDSERAATVAALAKHLPALGAAGQLQELQLWDWSASTGWLAAMQSLRRLTFSTWRALQPLHIPAAIGQLTRLEHLHLERAVAFDASVRLPPSITRLAIGDQSATMPAQLTMLPNLQHLQLLACYSPDMLEALSALSGLTRLEVYSGMLFCMAAFTCLQRLDWSPGEDASLQAVDEQLQHLTRLTCLELSDTQGLPPALGRLPHLQRLYLRDVGEAALPGGPMLRSLRWLSADIDFLLNNLQTLPAAAALEYVAVADSLGGKIDWGSAAMTGLFSWLAQHPPLRRLSFDALWHEDKQFDWPWFVIRVLQLVRRRPELSIRCPGIGDEGGCFYDLLDTEA